MSLSVALFITVNAPLSLKCLSMFYAVEACNKTRRLRWYMLLRSYGQETTLHGLRYIIEPTNLMCRR